MDLKVKLKYISHNNERTLTSKEDENIKVNINNIDNKCTVSIIAKKKLTITYFSITAKQKFSSNSRVFVNGYQSWTDSREYFINEKMDEISRIADWKNHNLLTEKRGLDRAGDRDFQQLPNKRGVFYGFSYGYTAYNDDNIMLYGSLSERSGYTIITFDSSEGTVELKKDLQGKYFEGENELLSFVVINGKYDSVFDEYFNMLDIHPSYDKRLCGYTTWYNYWSDINEDIVFRDLKALLDTKAKIDIFQIDDGYQKNIGDWLVTDENKFKCSMKAVADKIHQSGIMAGLWLAPFAAVPGSDVYKNHFDWIIKDDNGKPYLCGGNWGGFYAIDFYNEQARAYIKKVFDTVLFDWGFDMVKLDFLYAACILPIHNKTRGEIMCDAMDFLRECCKDKLILGCGVPMMPAFGKVDFCRIGSDVDLKWKRYKHRGREGVSTPKTINCTIFRRHLDGRAFLNDPDVFFLRRSNIELSEQQERLIAEINSVFGSLLFVSDNAQEYTDEQKEFLKFIFESDKPQIEEAKYIADNTISIKYRSRGVLNKTVFNCVTGKVIPNI